MATASAFERQPLPITREEVDTSAQLIALLDATLDHHRALVALAAAVPGARRASSAFLIDLDPTEDNERVVRLWASANNFALRDETFHYDPRDGYPHGYTIRAIRVYAGDKRDNELVHMAFGAVAKPEPVTAPAVIAALRAPHWTDDTTLTDEERAEREQMEAGHA